MNLRWSERINKYLSTGRPRTHLSHDQQMKVIKVSTPFQFIFGQLNHRGQDGTLRLCLGGEEYKEKLQEAHTLIGGKHFSSLVTEQCILQEGFWWSTLRKDAHQFVLQCLVCQYDKTPLMR